MRYEFKAAQELYWSVLTAVATVLLIELVSLNPDGIQDWRKWAVALGVAMLRAGAGAALDWLRRNMMAGTEGEHVAPPLPERPFVLHRHPLCGNPGLLATRSPVHDREMLNADEVRHLSSQPFARGETITCDTCLREIQMIRAESGTWIATSAPETLTGVA